MQHERTWSTISLIEFFVRTDLSLGLADYLLLYIPIFMHNMSAAAAEIAAEDMKGMQVSTESNEAEEELGGPGEGMDADSDDNLDSNANGEASAKKKKKRKKKKKSGAAPGAQTTPPSVGLSQLFPDGAYPEGEFQQYKDDQRWRETDEEKRAQERADADMVNSVRKAAEVHRQVRSYVQTIAKPGVLLIDMCEKLEDCSRKLIEENGLEAVHCTRPTASAGLNHVAVAHWHSSVRPGGHTFRRLGVRFRRGWSVSKVVAAHSDAEQGGRARRFSSFAVMKVDFGTQINGRIIDCAWTVAHNPRYDQAAGGGEGGDQYGDPGGRDRRASV